MTRDDESSVTVLLLGKRRFLPFFITRALRAFNDNVLKQSLILAIIYKLSIDGDRPIWVNLCALLFILRFVCSRHWPGSLTKLRQGRADSPYQAGRDRHHASWLFSHQDPDLEERL